MNYFIWSEEHGAWWRPSHNGYTSQLRQAGRYSADEAQDIVNRANMGQFFNEVAVEITPALEAALKLGDTPR